MASLMDLLVYGSNFAWIILIVVFLAYGQRIQIELSLRNVNKRLQKLEKMNSDAMNTFIDTLKKKGVTDADAKSEANIITNTFLIKPTNMDPHGVVNKLEQLVRNYEDFFIGRLKRLMPNESIVSIQNMSNIAESALALNEIYKFVRHYYISAKKYHDYYSLIMLQIQMPSIIDAAEAYFESMPAFISGESIGDTLGPVVLTQLSPNVQYKEIVKDTEMGEIDFEGRKLVLIKAKGPGGTVGVPGEAISKVLDSYPASMVITVDAALKLEGEDTGETVEGYGVAIGGLGTDRFEVEEAAARKKVPLYVVVVKMSLKEAICKMTDKVRRASLDASEKVKAAIKERTKEGDIVIVAGIGNTIGIP
ncbi:MAG: DUF1512 family protein [Conexivisphaerales archaeon]